MLISNFVKTAAYVSLSDIQFATSIALDLLGEETAASKVLTLFLDTTETTESSAHPRNVLEGYLREKYGDGIVLGFISTIYDGEYIELRKDSLYDTKKKVSLKSLLQHTSLENVYNKTMQLLAENPTSKLIYIYTKTSMWFKQFKPRAVPIALQGNTDLIIRLNDAFAEESVKQFCDSGAYESSTCTPQYFLLYAYAHWFKDKKTYIQIVNSRSTLRGTSSEDKRSILDKYVEDSDTYADDNVAYGFDNGLDFRNIASKIYQASISLFNHLSSLTAYDDIFSWYKSSLIEEIRRKNKGSLDSMKRYYELVILEEDSYLSNEKKRKRIARYKLCHQFSTILEQGLALEDIYDFYLHIANEQLALAGNGKDGLPLLTYGKFTVKKGNNADIFERVFEGFIALRELLEFLNSPRNHTGVDVLSFPVAIFREPKLLSRFSDINVYVKNYNTVKDLMSEVTQDVNRGAEVDEVTGLLSNEAVYNKLLVIKNNNSETKKIIQKAYNISLSEGEEANRLTTAEKFSLDVIKPLNAFVKELSNGACFSLPWQEFSNVQNRILTTDKQPVVKIFQIIIQIESHLAVMINSNYHDLYRKNAALATINLCEALLLAADIHLDNNGLSLINGRTIKQLFEEAGLPEQAITKTINGKQYTLSSVRLTQIFKIAEKVLEIPDNDYDISFTFNCARVLNSLFLRIQKCVLSLNADVQQGATSYKGNYFLCYAHLYSQKISNLKVPVSRLSNLSPFLDRPFISASYDLSMRNAQLEMEAYKKNYTELLLKVLNTNLLQYEKALIIFKDARLSAQTVLTTVGAPIGLSAAKTEALHALHVKIITTKEKTTSIKLIKMLLNRYGFTVDSNQYLMLNGSYYKVGKYYVHSSGYKVAPGVKEEPDDIVPMINPLSPEDEANIRLSFRVEDD